MFSLLYNYTYKEIYNTLITNTVPGQVKVYIHDTTTNNSFMKVHYYLKAKGIKNNSFFLSIYDPDLIGVDPRDPALLTSTPQNNVIKMKILRECMVNFWYFIREVVRLPAEGREIPYNLHRGNLAMNYMFVYNINQFVEFPRQHGKTVSALCWYLWVFNFGGKNIKMLFAHKKHSGAKDNLKSLKNIRELLPPYLKMDSAIDPTGKQVKAPNTLETLQNPINKNLIVTLPGARTPSLADGAGRGATMAIQFFDEFAFLPYNDIVYTAAAPAFSKAADNANKYNAPFGMLISTTPGDLTTREGAFANSMRMDATEWNENFYDMSYNDLKSLIDSNNDSTFMHIRYTYKMLGSSESYFKEMVRLLGKNWGKIRREVLLEWARESDANPFDKDDLELISANVKQEPYYTLFFGKSNQFQMKFWDSIQPGSIYPPIIGVDVSSGINKDSSAITVIDSQTTKVIATFKSNFITMPELADLIYRFVTGYAKNAIVNIENNGGFGSSVLQMLLKTSIKKNLYYEVKDRPTEEVYDGIRVKRNMRKCRVYGSTSSKAKRDKLIELLHQRVRHHRDKFNSVEIYNELCTLVVKPNGKTEHNDDAHDDLLFSYLWALYVFYYGEDLVNRYHLLKTEIQTDDNYNETSFELEEDLEDQFTIESDNFGAAYAEDNSNVADQLSYINSGRSMSMEDLNKKMLDQDKAFINRLLRSDIGREIYAKHNSVSKEELDKTIGAFDVDITNDLNSIFYGDDNKEASEKSTVVGNLADMFMSIFD